MLSNKVSTVILIAFIFIVGILIGIFLVPEKIVERTIQQPRISQIEKEMLIVGVDNNGKGVAAKLFVEIKQGSGLVLVNINDVLADYLTQLSARTAAKVASNFTEINTSHLDIIYSIKANATTIEGPSAGAAMTLATIAALQNKTINNSVFITGTIEESGTIGLVSGIGEKAQAAKDNNASLFLIPQARYVVGYDEVKECRNINNINYCEIAYFPKQIDLSEVLRLEIKPVSNISEAASYVLI